MIQRFVTINFGAARCLCGMQHHRHHDQLQLFQYILHQWVLPWAPWQGEASSFSTDFILSPASPSESRTEPRNWSETPEAPTSSDVQEDFVFQHKRGSQQDPAPQTDTDKAFPSRRHSSVPRAPSPGPVLTHHFPSADTFLLAHLLSKGHPRHPSRRTCAR